MRCYYLSKEEARRGIVCVYLVQNSQIENYEKYFENYNMEAIEFIGDELPSYIHYDEELNLIRGMTEIELIKAGIKKIPFDKYLDGDILKDKPSAPEDIFIKKWDDNKNIWIEGATPEQIEELKLNRDILEADHFNTVFGYSLLSTDEKEEFLNYYGYLVQKQKGMMRFSEIKKPDFFETKKYW